MSLLIRTGTLLMALCAVCAPSLAAPGPADAGTGDELLIVHCLLPGQVRQLGSRTTYVSPRRGARITAAECEARGGEYVREDSGNPAGALAIWLPAAREGDLEAQINVGRIFERGLGRSADLAEAARWYRQAAEGGSVRAQLKLSELYEMGRGVPVDLEEAVRWYRTAMGEEAQSSVVVDALGSRNAVLAEEVESISRTLAQLNEDNAALQAAVQAGTQRSQLLRSENAAIGEQMQQLEALLVQRERDIEQLSAQLEDTRQALARRAAAVEGSQSVAAEAEQRRALAESALLAADSRLAEQRQLLEERDTTVEALEGALADIRRALAAEQNQVASLSARLEHLQTGSRGTEALATQALARAAFAPPTLTLIDPRAATTRGLVKVSAPAPGARTRLVGRVEAAAGLFSLTVDGLPVSPNAAGVFMAELEGSSAGPVRIIAVDQAGQAAEIEFEYRGGSAAAEAVVSKGWDGLPFGSYKALVIGNNRYSNLPVLQSAQADAVALADVLRRRYGFEVTLLENATRFQILSALNELRESLTSNDNLVIYYAGHGELDRVNMRGYWLPVDAERTNTANWISSVSITDILNAMNARHVLLMADSCYSGALTRSSLTSLASGRTEQETLNWARTMLEKRSRQALTSGGLQPVLDSGGGAHSIFADALLQVLRSNEQVLEGRDLFEAVAARVAYRSSNLNFEQVPEFAPIRNAGHEAGAFFFRPR